MLLGITFCKCLVLLGFLYLYNNYICSTKYMSFESVHCLTRC